MLKIYNTGVVLRAETREPGDLFAKQKNACSITFTCQKKVINTAVDRQGWRGRVGGVQPGALEPNRMLPFTLAA